MTNEECKKAREAYRFLFSMQKFLVDSVEQIMATINYNRRSGMQMFSDKISTTKPALNDCINKFGDGMWAWDYFPAYMYMYYFELEKEVRSEACFAIIQIMDDGSFNLENPNGIAPDPNLFKTAEESNSFFLFAFSKWDNESKRIWFDNNEEGKILEPSDEIIRIATILNNDNKTYYAPDRQKPTFIVKKVGFLEIKNKEKTNIVLEKFNQLIKEKCGYDSFLK